MPRHKIPLAVLTVLLNHRPENAYRPEALIMRRGPNESLAGMYTIPGGHIEYRENAIEAGIRELEEETGLVAKAEDCFVAGVIHATATTKEYVQFIVIVEHWEGEPSITEPDQCDDMHWCPIDTLPENILGWPLAAIEMAAKIENEEFYDLYVTNLHGDNSKTVSETEETT